MIKQKATTKSSATEPIGSLEAARQAAIKCVEAVVAFREAALNGFSGLPPDHRPYITSLYAALRQGWEPICRYWPQLAEEHLKGLGLRSDESKLPPVMAWLTAKDVFWVSVVNTCPY